MSSRFTVGLRDSLPYRAFLRISLFSSKMHEFLEGLRQRWKGKTVGWGLEFGLQIGFVGPKQVFKYLNYCQHLKN